MRQPLLPLMSRRPQGHHAGLILQRYLADDAPDNKRDPDERRALFRAAVEAARAEPVRRLYRMAFDRWTRCLPPGTLIIDLRTAGRMIVGLGADNVLETGLRLHHSYGLPLIPGSALKGLSSHYCDHIWGQKHQGEAAADDNRPFRRGQPHHDLLFGKTDDGGVITYHDAWIHPDSLSAAGLVQDVMTPHHPCWQMNEAAPTDFDSPNPVTFLAVAGTFRVALSWGGPPDHLQASAWTRLALQLLTEALKEWGVGGKTTSGYGRLEEALTPGPAPLAALPQESGSITVRVLAPHQAGGRSGFFVQEEGKRRGVLLDGKPPPTLPEIGSLIQVYPSSTDPRSPRYRWDQPPDPPQWGQRPRR